MKPELLVPVGNPEAFYAAQKGGADAVYLGLRKFNARGRAKNFAINQLQSLLKEADRSHMKVYVTLNTLIKNTELSELMDTLYLLEQTSANALIIQDWGVYYLATKFFKKLKLHASTQMGNHNSLGTAFSAQNNFERIILARELTRPELEEIARKSEVQLEVFVHGALCYSFSGYCLFSSFLGGHSANRGLCRQPCRRLYTSKNKSQYLFSLKDNQQIELVPQLKKMGISSLKIEGRMKSAEYVYQVTRAYRMALDDNSNIPQAKEILQYDFGREKTKYFLGKNVSEAISNNPYSGLQIGKISRKDKDGIYLTSQFPLTKGNRIRILPKDGTDSQALKIKEIEKKDENLFFLPETKFQVGDKIFLAGLGEFKFKNKFQLQGKKLKLQMPSQKKANILGKIGSTQQLKRTQIFVRINSLKWLRKIYFNRFDQLILNLPKTEWMRFHSSKNFLQKHSRHIIVELPKFIPEGDLEFYSILTKKLVRNNYRHFMLSHLSQKQLLPPKAIFSVNENVYTLNDAAIQMVKETGAKLYVTPQENEYSNLLAGKDRKAIVPLYFLPQLFYSRMPIDLPAANFQDRDKTYRRHLRNGFTVITPQIPVSLLQYKEKLYKKGFRRFLIDFSYGKPSQNTFNRIMKNLETSTAEQPSTTFNFKMGLK
ncbi:MAG: family peptidase [Candidatus Cloacimonadota bacterium]|nr:family peptidase [Candidatus Cloacimonadota bacterium]